MGIASWLTLHTVVVVLGLSIYILGTLVRHQRRRPSAAMAWIISLALLPYVALPLYFLFGNRKVLRDLSALPAPHASPPLDNSTAGRLQHLAAAMGLPESRGYQELNIHADGAQALDALRRVIQSARQTLDVCTFIISYDVLGREIAQLLVERVRAGVKVRLMVDGVGIYMGGNPHLKSLSQAGVDIAYFVLPWRSARPGRTNLRNHRKMVIVDGVLAWTGGRNLAAEYFLGDPDVRAKRVPWKDLSFDLQGPAVKLLHNQFERDWHFAKELPPPPGMELPEPSKQVRGPSAQLIASGPDQADDTIYSLLISSCFTARERIVAVTPYFVPDDTLLMALTLAARRGVAVDLVLPAKSNHKLADIARNAALRDMDQAGARVWMIPDMIHAKGFVIDNEVALAGSANLDERSLFLNYEMMLAFYDEADVIRFADWIHAQHSNAVRFQTTPTSWLRDLSEGLVRWVAFQL